MNQSTDPQVNQPKRSKRHRTQRNHISKRDLAEATKANMRWAYEVRMRERKKYHPSFPLPTPNSQLLN